MSDDGVLEERTWVIPEDGPGNIQLTDEVVEWVRSMRALGYTDAIRVDSDPRLLVIRMLKPHSIWNGFIRG